MVTRKMRKIEKIALKALKRIYSGDGLYVRINTVTVPICFGDRRDIDTYHINGVYGRIEDNECQYPFKIILDSDYSADFMEGLFFVAFAEDV